DNARPMVNGADDQEAAQAVDNKLAKPHKIGDESKTADNPLPVGAEPTRAQVPSDGAKNDAKKSLVISQPAIIEAHQQVQVYSRVAGIVKTVMVDVGDRVKQGQVLVELDAPDVELELRQKTAMVQQAKAEINQAKSSVRAAQAVFEAAKALVLEAEAGVKG